MKKRLQDFIMMNLGVILLTLGVYFFKIPNGFSTGGVSGKLPALYERLLR